MKTKRTFSPRQVLRQNVVRSAKPNHVGPVGRKMWRDDIGIVYPFKETAVLKTENRGGNNAKVRPVLVISLDPANVERIRELVARTIDTTWANLSGQPRGVMEIDRRAAEAVLAALGLTPAKRKGRKAQ